jgi:hypothetical protein
MNQPSLTFWRTNPDDLDIVAIAKTNNYYAIANKVKSNQ